MASSLPTLAAPDDDPWLWLEEVEGERATSWADAQTAATLQRFGGAQYEADRDTLRTLLDRPDNLPVPARRGGLLYNIWKDAAHPRGLWRRTTLDSYRTETPAWDVLLDLDAVAAAESEDWVWMGSATLPPNHDRAILRLSRGGSDAVVLREFDLTTRSFVPDGFTLPEAKGGADWLDRDTLLLSSAGQGATQSGYATTVRLWRRGEAPGEPIFQVDPASMGASGHYDRAADRLLFVEYIDFFNTHVSAGDRAGPKLRFDLPTDAGFQEDRGWLAIRPRSPWTVGDRSFAPDTVVGIGLDAFLAGDRAFTVLFEPTARRALQGFSWVGGSLLVSVLDELAPVFLLVQPGEWTVRTLNGLPQTGTANAWCFDVESEEADGTLLALVQDPLTPPTLLMVAPGLAAPAVLKHTPPAFDAAGLVVTRHEAVSSDGERIPYTQSGPPGETGDAPVHMTGYGGFRVSSLPSYALRSGKLWLERGGTTVIANIRGGGEFGTRWHEAGRREGKRLSHDDFAAVAADLVRRGVTRPGRIAAEGGSNGGLLIANMLTRFPERFGALFCTIPLIDMRRYTQLLAGASWIAEYGDPANPDDWAFLGPISAYHAAEPGRPYPPILLATARRDDRVHPGHARKMAAKLQAMGYDAHFYEPAAGGHGYGKDNAEVAAFSALGMAFLRQAIGWS
jgi:prolyl oligopeptidase